MSEIDDRPADLGVGRTGAAEQHQAQRRVGPVPGHHLQQQAMVLVRMRDRRVHDVRTVPEPVAPAHARRSARPSAYSSAINTGSIGALRTPWGTTTTRGGVDPERVDHGATHELARRRDHGRTRDGSRHHHPQVAQPQRVRSTAGARGTAGRARSAGSGAIRRAAPCPRRGGRCRNPVVCRASHVCSATIRTGRRPPRRPGDRTGNSLGQLGMGAGERRRRAQRRARRRCRARRDRRVGGRDTPRNHRPRPACTTTG